MQTQNFDEALDQIVVKDPRYHRDAYVFLKDALDHTQKRLGRAAKKPAGEGPAELAGQPREKKPRPPAGHVTGQELLEGIREFALEQFGPMTATVFEEWGVHRCEDFGELVFNMVQPGLLGKTEKDNPDDFKGGYDFAEAFRKPFLPAVKLAANLPATPAAEL